MPSSASTYFYGLIGVELTLVMLAAPAATAGAICLDRARGTLAHMLMTDLSDPEIVLGKLAARLMPVMGLVACSWPVMAMCALLGGIDPIALTARVRDHRGRGDPGLHDRPDALGLGQEVSRSDPGDLYRLHPGLADLADLGDPLEGLRAAPALDAPLQPVLCGIRPLRGPGQARTLGLPRLLRRDAGSVRPLDGAGGLANAGRSLAGVRSRRAGDGGSA